MEIRKLFSNVFIFKTSKLELQEIFDELVEQNKNIATTISKIVYDKPYQYLMINTAVNRLFKNFDEILINNEK